MRAGNGEAAQPGGTRQVPGRGRRSRRGPAWTIVAVLVGGATALVVHVATGLTCAGPACRAQPPAPRTGPVAAAATAPVWTGWPGAPAAPMLSPVVRTVLTPPSGASDIALGISPDGLRLLSVDDGGAVTETDLRTGATAPLPLIGAVAGFPAGTSFGVAISPDLATVAVAAASDVSVQRVASGTALDNAPASLPSLEGTPGDLALSPDGGWLAFRDGSGNVRLVNVATRSSRLLRTPGLVPAPGPVPSGSAGGAASIAFSPDGMTLAVGTSDGDIDLWAVSTGRLLATLADPPEGSSAGPPPVGALAFGEGGALLAAADDNGNVYLWNVADRDIAGALPGTPATTLTPAYDIAFSPDGRLLAASFSDDTIGVWSVATGARLADLPAGQVLLVAPIAFGLGGSLLISLNGNAGITEWNLR